MSDYSKVSEVFFTLLEAKKISSQVPQKTFFAQAYILYYVNLLIYYFFSEKMLHSLRARSFRKYNLLPKKMISNSKSAINFGLEKMLIEVNSKKIIELCLKFIDKLRNSAKYHFFIRSLSMVSHQK